MKKLIVSALAVVALSCSEDDVDPTFCWACVTTATVTYTPADPNLPAATSTTNQELCNTTESGIRDYEKAGSVKQTVTVGGLTSTTETAIKCTKK